MRDSVKDYIKMYAFLGNEFIFNNNIGCFKCPTINELGENLINYLYLVDKFIDIYDENKKTVFKEIIENNDNANEFAYLLGFFIKTEKFHLKDNKLIFNNSNYIDSENTEDLFKCLKILHHRAKKDDDYKPSNKIAEEMMRIAKKRREALEKKIKKSNGIGILEIMSTVCARHPSINQLNIKELSYYQILEQYNRLMAIDLYTPCLYGNATEDYIKNNNIKHYSYKLDNV